jgi:hypothetical protein
MSADRADQDLVVEVQALRAELDALKRAFMTEALDQKLSAAERPLIIAEAVEATLESIDGSVKMPDKTTRNGTV